MLLCSATLSLLALLAPASQPALPVRWTAHVPLAAAEVADLKSYLARPVPLGGNTAGLTLVNGQGKELIPTTGQDWVNARHAGFTPKTNADNKLESWFKKAVLPALWLHNARASTQSFVADLQVDENLLSWLPPDLGFLGDPSLDPHKQRLTRHPTWGDLFPRSTVAITSPHQAAVDDLQGTRTTVTLLARGDVNGDTLEDLLLEVTTHATAGTFAAYEYVTLTRLTPTGPLVRLDRIQSSTSGARHEQTPEEAP